MMKAFLRYSELIQNIRKTLVASFSYQYLNKWIDQKWRKKEPDSGKSTGKYELPYSGKNGKPFTTTVNLDFMQIQSEPRKDPSGAYRPEKTRPMACSLILVGEEKKEGQSKLPKQSFTKVDKTAVHF